MYYFFSRKPVENKESTPTLDPEKTDTIIETDDVNQTTVAQLESTISSLSEQVVLLTNKIASLESNSQSVNRSNEVILYFDGTIYVGSVRSDSNGYMIPHGYGTICYPFGSRYIGEWCDGEFHGKGTYYYDYYTPPFTSDWVNHIPHGNATWDGVHYVAVKNGLFQQK